MKSIMALFDSYKAASDAVDALLNEDFDEEDVNAIAAMQIVKDAVKDDTGAGLHAIDVQKSDAVGGKTVHGLNAILGGQRDVALDNVGRVYAGGAVATNLVRTASAPGAVDGGLKGALIDYDVPEDVAQKFQSGLAAGKVLLWLRADDAQSGTALSTLREHGGKHANVYNEQGSPRLTSR